MATTLTAKQSVMETDLIMNHCRMVRILEMEYTNHIQKLLKQKSSILDNLQQQFIDRRDKIKQIFAKENNDVNHAKFNDIPTFSMINNKELNISNSSLSTVCSDHCVAVTPSTNNKNIKSSINEKKSVNFMDQTQNIVATVKKKKRKKIKRPNMSKPNEAKTESTKQCEAVIKKKKVKSKDKIHQCPDCEYSTNIKTNLTRHIRRHTGEKPFPCNYGECQKRFSCASALADHLKRHIGDKRHKCTFCEKAFVTKAEMASHTRIHTGAKPFICPHCKERFGRRNALKRHIKQSH